MQLELHPRGNYNGIEVVFSINMAIYGNSQTIAIVLNAIHINTLYNTYGNMAILFKKNIYAYAYRIAINLALFMCHNVQHHIIGSSHGIGTDGGEVVDALVHIIIHDALGRCYALAFHRQ